ncbi:MAG: hypothetical protein Q4P33_09435 [Flaviflexus sp.]|nr:hypothetical protein [Flaviflexus sp.]
MDWIAEHRRRIARLDRSFRAESFCAPRGSLVQLIEGVAIALHSQEHAEDSWRAFWGARITHEIEVWPGENSTVAEIGAALTHAVGEAVRRNRRMGTEVDARDRTLTLTAMSRDDDVAEAAIALGFRPDAVWAWTPRTRLEERLPTVRGVCVERTDDPSEIAETMGKVQRFDGRFMAGFRDRPTSEGYRFKYAMGELERGAWAGVIRVKGQTVSLCTVSAGDILPNLAVGPAAHIGFIWTEPQWRGRGYAGEMLRTGLDTWGRDAEAVTVGYAVNNPLSAPMWLGLGFRPAVTVYSLSTIPAG